MEESVRRCRSDPLGCGVLQVTGRWRAGWPRRPCPPSPLSPPALPSLPLPLWPQLGPQTQSPQRETQSGGHPQAPMPPINLSPRKKDGGGPALPFWVGQSPFSWPLAREALERRGHGSPDSMGATCRTALFIYLLLIFCPTRSMWKAPGWGLSQCHRGGNARIPNQLRPKATPFNSF